MKLKNLKKEILFMKRLKLAALTTALVLSVTAFAACGKKDKDNAVVGNNWSALKLTDVYNTTYVEKDDYTPITATKIDEFTGYKKFTISNSGYTLANYNVFQVLYKETEVTKDNVVTKVTTYKLYNLMLNKVVKTFTVDDAVYYTSGSVGTYVNFVFKYQYIGGARYVYAVQAQTKDLSTGTGTTDTYSLDGKLLSSSATVTFKNHVLNEEKDEDGYTDYILDFIMCDSQDETVSETYSVDVYTGATSKKTGSSSNKTTNEIKDFDNSLTEIADRKLDFDDRGYIYVYDKDTEELKFTFDLSAPVDDSSLAVINNGNVLYQTMSILPEDAENYDFINVIEGTVYKFALKSYVLNLKDGSKSEVKLDYVVADMWNEAVEEEDFLVTYKEGIENVAEVRRIVDKRMNGFRQLAIIKNDLTVVGVVEDCVPNQSGEVELVGDNLFIVYSNKNNGEYFYVDSEGKIVGKHVENINGNGDFVWTDDALYNARTLVKLTDFESDEYSVEVEVQNFGGNIVVKKSYASDDKPTEHLMYKRNSTTPVLLYAKTAQITNSGIDSDYYFYQTKSVDASNNTIVHSVYKNAANEVILEYDSNLYSDDTPLCDASLTRKGVKIGYKLIHVRNANGTVQTEYHRFVR